MLQQLERGLNRFSNFLGIVAAILFVLLLFNVFFDVVMRYLFNDVSIGMQELEWHLYASIFLLGIPYGLCNAGHVRVDMFYERFSARGRAWVDLFGTLFFLLPFTLLVAWYGIGFTIESWELGERSGDPGGLYYRWIIKSMIPFAFSAMTLAGISLMLHSINTIRGVDRGDGSNLTEAGRGGMS